LGNGARLERLNFLGDMSERALQQSHGLMVNYLYDLEHIEQNHEAYAQQHAIVAASAVTRLVRAPTRDVVPAAERRRSPRARSASPRVILGSSINRHHGAAGDAILGRRQE